MAKVFFYTTCTATYESSMEIPKEIQNDNQAVLEYIHKHLDNGDVRNLQWVGDLDPEDAVTIDDIIEIETEE